VVAGAESTCNVLLGDQAETKAVTSGTMFFCIALEVIPEMIRQGVFRLRIWFQNAVELRALDGELRELKSAHRFETDKENALAVLRYDALRINHLWINLVAQMLFQCLHDDTKCPTVVVAAKILHIFQHKRGWFVVVENVRDEEEKITLLQILEAVLATEAVLLGDACEANPHISQVFALARKLVAEGD